MNEMKRSGVATKREKMDSVASKDADVEACFEVGIVTKGLEVLYDLMG